MAIDDGDISEKIARTRERMRELRESEGVPVPPPEGIAPDLPDGAPVPTDPNAIADVVDEIGPAFGVHREKVRKGLIVDRLDLMGERFRVQDLRHEMVTCLCRVMGAAKAAHAERARLYKDKWHFLTYQSPLKLKYKDEKEAYINGDSGYQVVTTRIGKLEVLMRFLEESIKECDGAAFAIKDVIALRRLQAGDD
jgi:hypothetical protein